MIVKARPAPQQRLISESDNWRLVELGLSQQKYLRLALEAYNTYNKASFTLAFLEQNHRKCPPPY